MYNKDKRKKKLNDCERNVRTSYKKSLKILDAVNAYMPTSEYTDVWGILTGLEWAETVLAADGDRETTGLMS